MTSVVERIAYRHWHFALYRDGKPHIDEENYQRDKEKGITHFP